MQRLLSLPFSVAMIALLTAAGMAQAPGAGGNAQNRGGQPGERLPLELLQRATRDGRVRVIIGLNVDAQPEGRLSGFQRAAQRAQIATAQDDVEAALNGFDVADLKRFGIVAGMAAEVNSGALQFLATHPRVAYIEEDRLAAPTLDASASRINAPVVWSSGYTGTGQAVAILDTGVERTHSFFGGRVVSEACYSTTNASYPSTSLCPGGTTGEGTAMPTNCAGISGCDHGTHVAGIAAGSGSSFSGIAKGGNIIAVQVFSKFAASYCGGAQCLLSFTSDQILGLQRVFDLRGVYNIASVNMSLGGGAQDDQARCDSRNTSIKAAIDQLRSVGIATVIASGNGDANGNGYTNALSEPGCISTAISVGSTRDGGSGGTPADSISTFSNRASFLSLLAPGQVINSATTGGGFIPKNGTSMATPHVAGAWALLKSRFSSASVTQVLTALQTSGVPVVDSRNGLTFKRIDLPAAMIALAANCTFSIDPNSRSVSASSTTGTVAVTTQAGCAWTAVSNNIGYLSVLGGAVGIGSGTVSYSLTANTAPSARSGTLTIGGLTFTINQAAGSSVIGDFNGDGKRDLLWHHQTNGNIAVWYMNGMLRLDAAFLSPSAVPDTNWRPVGIADFNSDGKTDILWQHLTGGQLFVWFMNGITQTGGAFLSNNLASDPRWRVRSVSDINNDGKPDLILQHPADGLVAAWIMNGTTLVNGSLLNPGFVSPDWRVAGAGDFNSDGKTDLVLQHNDGYLAAWYMNGINRIDAVFLNPNRILDTRWILAAVDDVNGDGKPDLILHHAYDGVAGAWLMNGINLADGALFIPSTVPDANWRIVAPR